MPGDDYEICNALWCYGCELWLWESTDFYKSRKTYCKQCIGDKQKQYRQTVREKLRGYSKKYRQNPNNQARIKKNSKARYRANRDIIVSRIRANRRADPNAKDDRDRSNRNQDTIADYKANVRRYRRRAYHIVEMALKDGTLTQGRCQCGSDNTVAIHPDFNKPDITSVIWMCRECSTDFRWHGGQKPNVNEYAR